MVDAVHLRFLHLAALVTVVGVPIGTALVKVSAYRGRDPGVILHVTRLVATVDFVIVAPSVAIQVGSGVLLADALGWSLLEPWLAASLVLYGAIGVAWAVAMWTQHRMKRLAAEAAEEGGSLPWEYHRHMKRWLWAGYVGLVCVVAIFLLMVYRPILWGG